MRIKNIPIAQLKPYGRNPRHNENAIQGVAESLKEFGWRQPIVAKSSGEIVVGHTRYEAAKILGFEKVPVVNADDLSAAQVKAYRIADNKTGEAASWDDELLKLELDDLQALDFDLALTGFESGEISSLYDSKNKMQAPGDAETEEDFKEIFHVIAECKSEEEQLKVLALLEENGHQSHALIS